MNGDAGLERAFPGINAADRHHEMTNRFSFHPRLPGQSGLYERVRAGGELWAREILGYAPASPELDRAIDCIDQAVMWANAAIARHWEG